MMKRLLFIIICMATALSTSAQTADTTSTQHRSLWRTVDAAARQNPALHGVAFNVSYSELSLKLDVQHQSEAFVPELGDGYTLPSLGVQTYLRVSDHTVVWGGASYMAGRQHSVVWNSTSDFSLLQPYVLADTLGGDTNREHYAFAGGYATQLGLWLMGAEMLFRAEQEYRDQDPRMRGVVTDLTLRFGAARDIKGYRLGAAFEGNIYKQTNSVAFYNEEGVIPEYQMTGLGTAYTRFSSDKRSIYYDGGGVGLLLSVAPTGNRGFYADLSLDEHRYHRRLAEYNSMPLTDLYREHAGATVGWRTATDTRRLAVFGLVDYTKRTGDEHVGGASDSRYFPTIASLTMYKNNLLNAGFGALYGCRTWTVRLHSGYRDITERYAYPHRQLDYSQVYGQLDGQLFVQAAHALTLTISAHAAHTANVAGTVVMPYANIDAKVTELVNHKALYAQASYTDLSTAVRADYALRNSRYGLYAELGGGAMLCSVGQHQLDLRTTIGITF
ncbi:MAG: hypothetical protein IJV38_04105 [Prevotella sp.]|nr:hypothetical protein [Prevotella sp.]